MSRLKVYRVEHTVSGTGPFCTAEPLADELSEHARRVAALANEVQQDCLGFVAGFHVCGVERPSQIAVWFGPFRERLLATGFALFEYEPLPRNVLPSQSGTQVAFAKYTATPRRRLDWLALPDAAP